MAITYVGGASDTEVNSNTNNMTLTLPGGATEDDLALVWASADDTSTVVLALSGVTGYAAPGGVTNPNRQTTGLDRVTYFWYKVLGASESNITVTTDTAEERVCGLMVFRGVDTATPFDVNVTGNAPANDDTPTNAAITPTNDNGALVLFAYQTHNNINTVGVPTTPTGLIAGPSEIGSNHKQIVTAYKLDYGTAATITPTAWTHNVDAPGNEGESITYTIALRAGATGELTTDKSSYDLASDTDIVCTITGRTETPNAVTIDGVTETIEGGASSSSATVSIPPYDDFVSGGDHADTPPDSDLTLTLGFPTEADLSVTIQFTLDTDGPTYHSVDVVGAELGESDGIETEWTPNIADTDVIWLEVTSGDLDVLEASATLVWNSGTGQAKIKFFDKSLATPAWSTELTFDYSSTIPILRRRLM